MALRGERGCRAHPPRRGRAGRAGGCPEEPRPAIGDGMPRNLSPEAGSPAAAAGAPEARLGTTHGRQRRAMNAVTTLANPDLVETVETVRALSVRRRRQATGNEGGASFDFAVCAHYCDKVLCTATRGVRHYTGPAGEFGTHEQVKRVSNAPRPLLRVRARTGKDGCLWLICQGRALQSVSPTPPEASGPDHRHARILVTSAFHRR